jgi:hypothetical protein
MDIEHALRKIGIQIKYGRVVEAERGLEGLWEDFKDNDKERKILEFFAFDLLKETEDYKKAIPFLQRLLDLKIDEKVRSQAVDFLNTAIEHENMAPSIPDVANPKFLDFMQTIRKREIFKPAQNFRPLGKSILIKDIEAAKELAWHQEVEAPFQSRNKLRTNASREVHSYC